MAGGAVDIGPVLDGHNVDALTLVIDAVDHPVIPAPRAMQSLKPELKRLADTVRIRRQRPVAELNDRRDPERLDDPISEIPAAVARRWRSIGRRPSWVAARPRRRGQAARLVEPPAGCAVASVPQLM
jgi:hypothetical protein